MNWDNFCIVFDISKKDKLFEGRYNSEEVLQCVFENGMLDFSIKYDFMDKPLLHLSSSAKLGDKIKVHILPYRIELYVNEVLADEEWPCGEHYLSKCSIIDNGCTVRIQESHIINEVEPSVIGTFSNAEGWKPEGNIFVGDCMPYHHNGVYHVLYLKDRHHHGSKWGYGAHQWNHISTDDFETWNIHPMAVAIDDPAEGSICTGSWIYDNGIHYLFYTVRMCDGSPAKICRSISQDGFHFEKDREFSFTLSNKYTAPSARDPKIVKDEKGVFHMILTTSLSDRGRGCLAHLISENLKEWCEVDEPLYISEKEAGEPECPDYFYKDGFYYLVYSLGLKGYYQYSKKPFSDWIIPKNPIIPCKSVPKAAIWNDRLIFAGFDGNGIYGGTLTFLEAVVGENGEFTYKSLGKRMPGYFSTCS
ncbi:MAG: hypothetical protein IJ439_01325 [Tyzzerella sp.]|nr:hypothetical protein [Tyzzerella sp.]